MASAKFGWNWSSGSGEEIENVKSLQQQQRQWQQRLTTDKFWSEKLTAHPQLSVNLKDNTLL